LNLLNHAHGKPFINHSDYDPSLVLACGRVHWLWFSPLVPVIAVAVLVVDVVAYPAAVAPETPGGFVAMSADLASAY
jgi:hypothetical protein